MLKCISYTYAATIDQSSLIREHAIIQMATFGSETPYPTILESQDQAQIGIKRNAHAAT